MIKSNNIKNRWENIQNRRLINSYEENKDNLFRILFNNGEYRTLMDSIKYMNYDTEEYLKISHVLQFYYYWDNLNYNKVVTYNFKSYPEILQPIEKKYKTNVRGWQTMIKYDRQFRLIIDLINKSARYDRLGRYNESILFLYRACELITHLELKEQYLINSEEIQTHKLTKLGIDDKFIENLGYVNKHHLIGLSLKKQFELLHKLNDNIGNFYHFHSQDFNDMIYIRNNSILTHGTSRITNLQYTKFEYLTKQLVKLFDKDSIQLLNKTQFPSYQLNTI